MMNLHGIKPGKKILILGSGNVGLAVGLSPMSQLLKMAGCEMEDNPKRGNQLTEFRNQWLIKHLSGNGYGT